MDIKVPFEVGQLVCHSSPERIFNAGVVESIEAEIFIKVREVETGILRTYKPQDIYSLEAAKEFVTGVLTELDELAAQKQG